MDLFIKHYVLRAAGGRRFGLAGELDQLHSGLP